MTESKKRKTAKDVLKLPRHAAQHPRFFYVLGLVVLIIVVLTWALHHYVAAPYGGPIQSVFEKLLHHRDESHKQLKSKLGKVSHPHHLSMDSDLLKPGLGKGITRDAPTLSALDKRLDRLEGMVTELSGHLAATGVSAAKTSAGAVSASGAGESHESGQEGTKDGGETALEDLQTKLFILETHLRDMASKLDDINDTPLTDGDLKAQKRALKEFFTKELAAFREQVSLDMTALDARLTQLEKLEESNAQRSVLVMAIARVFGQARLALVAGSETWMKPLESLASYKSFMSGEARGLYQDLLDNLHPFSNVQQMTPAAIQASLEDIVQQLETESAMIGPSGSNTGGDAASHAPKAKVVEGKDSYWSAFKRSLRGMLVITHKNPNRVAKEHPALLVALDYLRANNVAEAVAVVEKMSSPPPLVEAWLQRAKDWLKIQTLLTSTEESMLTAVLQPAIDG